MAFPQVEAVNGGNNTGAGTSHTVNLPSGIEVGDLLIVTFNCKNSYSQIITFPAGWTEVYQGGSSYIRFGVWHKVAGATEGSTITVTTEESANSCHTSYRISGYVYSPEIGVPVGGNSTTPDPPSLTPTWGADDTLWMAICWYYGSKTVSSYPASYTDGRNDLADDVAGCGVGTAFRELNSVSENPGTFTISGIAAWAAQTVAIRPYSTSVLATAQQAASYVELIKVVLTKTGATTYSYTNEDTLAHLEHEEQDDSYKATIHLNNADNSLNSIDFLGYTAKISYGVRTGDGDIYRQCAPLDVISQTFNSSSSRGGLSCVLYAVSIIDKMVEQLSDSSYLPSYQANTELACTVQAETAAGLSTMTVITIATAVGSFIKDMEFLVAGDATVYKLTEDCPIYFDVGSEQYWSDLVFTPVLAVTADATDVVTLTYPEIDRMVNFILSDNADYQYNLFGAIAYTWDSVDSLADAFSPREAVKLYANKPRLSSLNEPLSFCKVVKRLENDGIIHLFNPTVSGVVYDYEYVRTEGHAFKYKSRSATLVVPNQILVLGVSPIEGTATDATSLAILPKYVAYNLLGAEDNTMAGAIATAMLQKATLACKHAVVGVTPNALQQVWDYVKVTDSRESNSTLIGNVQSVKRVFNSRPHQYDMTIRFGGGGSLAGGNTNYAIQGIMRELDRSDTDIQQLIIAMNYIVDNNDQVVFFMNDLLERIIALESA